jgi:predicted secreted protein
MLEKIALLLVALCATAIVTAAPAQASGARPAYDTNWPCEGC